MGARKQDILVQFLIEAVVVTMSGGILGILLGYLSAVIASLITGTPSALSWKIFLLAFSFSASIGIFFGMQPARKAATLDPIEALR